MSWLPSFSLEVSRAQSIRNDHNATTNSQLDAMARQVSNPEDYFFFMFFLI